MQTHQTLENKICCAVRRKTEECLQSGVSYVGSSRPVNYTPGCKSETEEPDRTGPRLRASNSVYGPGFSLVIDI